MRFSFILTLLIILFSVLASNGQNDMLTDDELDHHDHHRHEIGIANSVVYFGNEEVLSYGMHIHYIYNFKETKFGAGLGYERIFDEHSHQTFGVVGSYRPIERWTLNVSPGFTIEGEENSDVLFAIHLETSYEFEFGNFHIGPVLEYAYDQEDYHISVGLHVGYGF